MGVWFWWLIRLCVLVVSFGWLFLAQGSWFVSVATLPPEAHRGGPAPRRSMRKASAPQSGARPSRQTSGSGAASSPRGTSAGPKKPSASKVVSAKVNTGIGPNAHPPSQTPRGKTALPRSSSASRPRPKSPVKPKVHSFRVGPRGTSDTPVPAVSLAAAPAAAAAPVSAPGPSSAVGLRHQDDTWFHHGCVERPDPNSAELLATTRGASKPASWEGKPGGLEPQALIADLGGTHLGENGQGPPQSPASQTVAPDVAGGLDKAAAVQKAHSAGSSTLPAAAAEIEEDVPAGLVSAAVTSEPSESHCVRSAGVSTVTADGVFGGELTVQALCMENRRLKEELERQRLQIEALGGGRALQSAAMSNAVTQQADGDAKEVCVASGAADAAGILRSAEVPAVMGDGACAPATSEIAVSDLATAEQTTFSGAAASDTEGTQALDVVDGLSITPAVVKPGSAGAFAVATAVSTTVPMYLAEPPTTLPSAGATCCTAVQPTTSDEAVDLGAGEVAPLTAPLAVSGGMLTAGSGPCPGTSELLASASTKLAAAVAEAEAKAVAAAEVQKVRFVRSFTPRGSQLPGASYMACQSSGTNSVPAPGRLAQYGLSAPGMQGHAYRGYPAPGPCSRPSWCFIQPAPSTPSANMRGAMVPQGAAGPGASTASTASTHCHAHAVGVSGSAVGGGAGQPGAGVPPVAAESPRVAGSCGVAPVGNGPMATQRYERCASPGWAAPGQGLPPQVGLLGGRFHTPSALTPRSSFGGGVPALMQHHQACAAGRQPQLHSAQSFGSSMSPRSSTPLGHLPAVTAAASVVPPPQVAARLASAPAGFSRPSSIPPPVGSSQPGPATGTSPGALA